MFGPTKLGERVVAAEFIGHAQDLAPPPPG
jgi:hypothetical protein